MTSPSGRADQAVPIGSAMVKALKATGPQSASALARRLKLRKADVLVACRALAAAGQMHRLGNRWAPRSPVRCAGLNEAGRRCARVAGYGTFCTHHEPDADAPPPGPQPLAPARPIAEKTPSMNARGVVASPVPPREQGPVHPPASDAAPELFVRGRRVTEADVIDALSMLGDEQVEAYRDGHLPKAEAYRIAQHRLRTLARGMVGR